MKDLFFDLNKDVLRKTSLWEAFILYLEKMYFPGAIESLDSGLITFEYEYFKTSYLF